MSRLTTNVHPYKSSDVDVLSQRGDKVIREVLNGYGEELDKAIQKYGPRVTGKMIKDMHIQVTQQKVRILNLSEYARYVIHGRGWVIAKSGSLLSYRTYKRTGLKTVSYGGYIYGKKSRPTKSNDFIKRAHYSVINNQGTRSKIEKRAVGRGWK